MTRFACIFSLFVFVPLLRSDDAASAFAIYPPVGKDTPGAIFYEFERAPKLLDQPDKVKGYHAAAPIITLTNIESVGSFWPEVGTVPWPALMAKFTSAGFKKLSIAVKDSDDRDYSIVVLGKTMANIKGSELSKIAAKKVGIVILLPKESGQENRQIAQKISAAIKGGAH